ncbi:MAG TPA: hypothetical protein VND93_10040 [Myxococcales bacterium]|nr:hypothetical protein [Myxococcales bacterium]
MRAQVKQQRLILFCSDVDVDLEEIHRTLGAVCDSLDVSALEVDEIDGPEALTAAGWTAVAVRPGRGGGDLGAVEKNLDALARACAAALREDILAVFLDHLSGSARACLQSPGGFPRSIDGEIFQVLRQTATWVEADAVQLMRFFAPPARPSELQAQAGELSELELSGDDKEMDPDPDEEDRFVESKLKTAREWMERYRAGRKR